MVLALPHVTKKEQVQFNTMRKHLQVLTLADITTGDGTQVTVSAKEEKRDKYCKSQYKWPKEAPTQKDQQTWVKLICRLTNNTWKVCPRLQKWTRPEEGHQKWEWYYFPHTGHLGRYIQGRGCWIYTPKGPQSLRSPTFNLSRWTPTKPQYECRRATVVKCGREKGMK